MQVWNVLHAARWKYRMQKIAKNLPSVHHCTTLLGYILATKAYIDNGKKLVKQQYMLQMSSQYGELRPTSGWDRSGSFDCFVQCKVVGPQISLDGVQPLDMRTPWWSLPVLWWGSPKNHLGIWVMIHMCNMPKYGKTLWLDYRCKVMLFSDPPDLINANKLLPFDSKQCSQAPLIKSINPACIHLGDCPAFRSV